MPRLVSPNLDIGLTFPINSGQLGDPQSREGDSRMRRQLPVAIVANLSLLMVSSLLLAIPVFAHHGFQFKFDGSKYVYITGTLTKAECKNPHINFNS